ncbi:MAG: BamA/TamA family outer membrane protein [Leptospiraceae bacterium]|nr:BamA/TamA family outer membrane protein [Leptospiraceae bacterium]MDW8307350.1 BamA/TamA family outer membrane protein [Leptospiraceae bacterium]
MRFRRPFFFFGALYLYSHISLSAAGLKVVWEGQDWQIIKGQHFDVHYPAGYDRLGKIALLYLEEANIYLSAKLKHRLSQVIPVFIYPSHSHFQSTNIIWERIDEGTGGFTERLKKRIAVPFLGSYDELRHVLTHELVHAFQYDILQTESFSTIFGTAFAQQPPLWFVEGMAEYFSIGYDETADMVVRDAILTDTLPTLEMMTNYRVLNPFIFYKGGQSIIQYLDERYGSEKISEILRDLRDQRNIEDAIRVNLGISLKELDEGWRLYVKRRYYRDINKNFDNEEALLLTDHLEDESFLNLHPAISPDGKKIAYLSIRNFFPAIVLREIKEVEKKPHYSLTNLPEPDMGKVIVQGGNNDSFYQLNILTNRLSFTPDGKGLFFSVRRQGREELVMFDLERKKVRRRYFIPLDMVRHPMLSPDGKKAAFSGTLLGQSDLYLLYLESGKIQRVTFDDFAENEPSFSEDGNYLLFSSNRNKEGNVESTTYHIFEMNLENLEVRQLTFESGKQQSPIYYSQKNRDRIIYVSNHTGSRNIYLKDLNTGEQLQITNTAGAAMEPMLSSSRELLVFAHYRKQGYDIAIRKTPQSPKDFRDYDETISSYSLPQWPLFAPGLSESELAGYKPTFTPDFLFFGFQYSNFFGFGGFLQFNASDYTGDHQINAFLDYLSARQSANFNLTYGYLKHRVQWFFGAYRISNYFSIFNLTNLASLNDFIYFPVFIASTMRYGVYTTALYPITPFFSIALQAEIGRYEEIYFRGLPENYRRKDIFTNINSLNAQLQYNNAVYSFFGPLTGWATRYVLEQTVNISGRDFIYQRHQLDLRRYFFFFQRYVIAMRFMYGQVIGPQYDYFPWQIGGFNTIRGYPFLSIKGTTMFVKNLELRFPFLDALIFGFPVPWAIRGFSGVFFIDAGAATETPRLFRAFRRGRTETQDLYLSYGLGIRLALFPGLLLKIDWATPWTLRSSLPISRWQGIFSLGYEF